MVLLIILDLKKPDDIAVVHAELVHVSKLMALLIYLVSCKMQSFGSSFDSTVSVCFLVVSRVLKAFGCGCRQPKAVLIALYARCLRMATIALLLQID